MIVTIRELNAFATVCENCDKTELAKECRKEVLRMVEAGETEFDVVDSVKGKHLYDLIKEAEGYINRR